MSDQHNRSSSGAYGNPTVRTPNLDRFAAEGARFLHASSNSPICVPARASLATGRYPHQTGCWDNATPYTGEEAPSWGHRLRDSGVPVTTIGKLHYRSAEDPTGFDDQRLPMHVSGDGDLRGLLRGDMPPKAGNRQHLLRSGAGRSDYVEYDRRVADAACRWLADEAGDGGEPWVLFTSFVSPHPPLVAPHEYLNLYDPSSIELPVDHAPERWPRHPAIDARRRLQALDEPLSEGDLRRSICAYYALVSFLDDRLGQVLDAVDTAGLTERTRVVYLSDHGEMLGAHGLWWKSVMYEGSLGVPLVVRGPDVPAGSVVATPVSLVDAFPTIVEATGAAFHADDADLPGTSWWRTLRGEDPHRYVFAEYHAAYSDRAVYAVHKGAFKYVHYEGGPSQLFDLVADPQERHDLTGSPSHREVESRLRARLHEVVDPARADADARAAQQTLLARHGGRERILTAGELSHTPVPTQDAGDA